MKTITAKNALLTAAALVATGVLAAGTAQAQASMSNRVTSAEIVHYGDLNLKTNHGANELYYRIDRAAETVCGDSSWDPSVDVWRDRYSCEQAAISRAVAQVDSTKLTAVFDRHFQGTAPAKVARASKATGAKEVAVG